jgi:beta-lactamase class A
VLLVAAFTAGWFGSRYETLQQASKNDAQPVRYNDPDYPLISPLVSVAIPNATGFPELTKTESDVQSLIDAAKKKGILTDAGVYFRLPANAHWFGINENGKFDPGSLIKVPIMLAYLKEAETNPSILDDKLYYNPQNNDALPNALPAQLPVGTYSASKLLEEMIIDSDNVAKDILSNHLTDKAIQDVFDETNSNFLQDPTGTISPKQYIIILSRIYSATYLDRYYSNYAMGLLTKTTFKDALAAGVPANVKVAHKYGERGVYEDNVLSAVELHDCGLVYADTPYYICVMTKGSDEGNLANLIKNISATIYNDRETFKPTN